ncbi:shikimate dehydrogenase [Alphaproteobacteria bacterium]|jgi:shikimate dehydrogenase|nr:shikimate dehydrogenase [Alphaproteobacteria bacterium]
MSNLMPWVTGKTRVFGVIADPVDHVRGPMVFNPEFAQRGLDHIMVPINVAPQDLATVIGALKQIPNFGGLAVTIPHKLALAELCDTLGPTARLTGAVNAVRFDADGSLHGDNFDGHGFVAGLRANGHDPAGRKILMIGAGGAARAIALALCMGGVSALTIMNRTPANAQAIVAALGKADIGNAIEIAGTDPGDPASAAAVQRADTIINTTSLGLHADDDLPLALDGVSTGTLIADIIMVPEQTAWLADAEARGLPVHYGRHMLDCQMDLIGGFLGAL